MKKSKFHTAYTGAQMVAFVQAFEKHKTAAAGAGVASMTERRFIIAEAMAAELARDPRYDRNTSPILIFQSLEKVPSRFLASERACKVRGSLTFKTPESAIAHITNATPPRHGHDWPIFSLGVWKLPQPTVAQRQHIARQDQQNQLHLTPATSAPRLQIDAVTMLVEELLRRPEFRALQAALAQEPQPVALSVTDIGRALNVPLWRIYYLASKGVGNGRKVAHGHSKAQARWQFDSTAIEAFRDAIEGGDNAHRHI